MAMLVARSMAECHLYIALHPCECGEADFRWSRHERADGPDGPVSAYLGTCPSCGRERRFDFRLRDGAIGADDYGGPEPSEIIDPGEFLALSQRAAGHADLPPDATAEERQLARAAAADALAAVVEVLKFVPPGADAVPPDAFTSEAGRAAYAANPTAFRRDRLLALLSSHQRRLAPYGPLSGGDASSGGFRVAREPADHDGPVLDPKRRRRVLIYLRGGAPLPSGHRTDGEWIWSERVTRLLDEHGMAPEPEFLQRIAERGYHCPPVTRRMADAAHAALAAAS